MNAAELEHVRLESLPAGKYRPDQPRGMGDIGGQWIAASPNNLPDLAVNAGVDALPVTAKQALLDYAEKIAATEGGRGAPRDA